MLQEAPLTPEQMTADLDFQQSLAQLFTLIPYGQLILEQAQLDETPEDVVDLDLRDARARLQRRPRSSCTARRRRPRRSRRGRSASVRKPVDRRGARRPDLRRGARARRRLRDALVADSGYGGRSCMLRHRIPAALLALVLAVLAFPAGADALSYRKATNIALRTLKPERSQDPVILYGLSHPVSSRARVFEVAKGSSRQNLKRIGRRSYLFWLDQAPGAFFEHPSTLLLVNASSGRIVRREHYQWWPLVDGKRAAFVASAKGYFGNRYRLWVSNLPSQPDRRVPRVTAAQSGGSLSGTCMVLVDDQRDPIVAGSVGAYRGLGKTLGVPFREVASGLDLDNALTGFQNAGCQNVLLSIVAHGRSPADSPNPSVALFGKDIAQGRDHPAAGDRSRRSLPGEHPQRPPGAEVQRHRDLVLRRPLARVPRRRQAARRQGPRGRDVERSRRGVLRRPVRRRAVVLRPRVRYRRSRRSTRRTGAAGSRARRSTRRSSTPSRTATGRPPAGSSGRARLRSATTRTRRSRSPSASSATSPTTSRTSTCRGAPAR